MIITDNGNAALVTPVLSFITHTGEIVSGDGLQSALDEVSKDLQNLALAIREEDAYAAHVNESEKDELLAIGMVHAWRLSKGEICSFSDWQRVNEKLTGKCIAFLSGYGEGKK